MTEVKSVAPLKDFTAVEAIKYLNKQGKSNYKLAMMLSDEFVTVQRIQLSNYLKGTKMHRDVAQQFYIIFNINITDIYVPPGRPAIWL